MVLEYYNIPTANILNTTVFNAISIGSGIVAAVSSTVGIFNSYLVSIMPSNKKKNSKKGGGKKKAAAALHLPPHRPPLKFQDRTKRS